jgi:hypothetical protein
VGEGSAALLAACDALVARPVFGLPSEEIVADLEALEVACTQLAAARSVRVRELDGRDYARTEGATSLPVWLRDRLRISIGEAHRRVVLSRLLDTHPGIATAMSDGSVNPEQATAIGRALADLPDDLDPALRVRAEAVLLEQATQFCPEVLTKLGARILDHIAPEVAEEALRRKLEQEEARARIARTFTISKPVSGLARVHGWLDVESAAVVSAAIDPLSKPQPGEDGSGLRSPGQRRADALVEICRLAMRTGDLPPSRGEAPQIAVTMNVEALRSGVGAAGVFDTGDLVSASVVRRLACDARIVPAVLGGDGDVLDVGRTQRLFTGPLRRAVVLRDGGCAFPGCDRPPKWCDCHHIEHWADGGATSLTNAVLLCGHHHRLIHCGEWQVRMGRDQRPEFVPPAHVDPIRRPRRNHHRGPEERPFHRRT